MKTVAIRLGLLAMVAYAALFALLALDAAARVWIMRSAFETQLDVGFLIVYEGMRVLTVAFAVVLAGVLATRARVDGPAPLTALLLVLLAVAYAKATTYEGFAGFGQERIARALLANGTPQELLRLAFAEPAWAVVLAGGAFLRLAATYPAAVTAEGVLAAGAADRRGMLRSAAVAGADVGALARRATAAALRNGMLRPAPVWTGALVLAAAASLPGGFAPAALAVGIGLPLLAGVPALRASLAAAAGADRARILWFVQAALLSASAFVLGGVLSVMPGAIAGWLAFAVLAITPLVVLLCIATALAPAGSIAPEAALRVTAHFGATALLTATIFALLETLLTPAFGGRMTVATALALFIAAAAAAPAHARLRAPAARLTASPLTPVAADR